MFKMLLFVKVRSFLQNFFATSRVETDLDREVQSHLEMLKEENLRAGMAHDEAQRAARIELGGIEQVKEQVREQRLGNWLQSILSDCRYALRQLRKSPAFTVIAVLTLALGIGANTAIFSVVQNVLLRSLPYRDAGRLVEIWNNYFPQWPQIGLSSSDFYEWRAQAKSVRDMAAYRFVSTDLNLTGHGETERVQATYATAALFPTLGIAPVLGRAFLAREDQPGSDPVALISHALWQSRFGGDPTAVGRTLTLDGRDYTLIGVLPAKFHLAPWADVWFPAGEMDPTELNGRVHHPFGVVARLVPGATLQQAQAELTTLAGQQAAAHPDTNANWGVTVHPLRDPSAVKLREALLVLFAAVGLVLLIACANLVNLLLVRNADRHRQIAVRMALGASRSRIFAQLLTETLVLALSGGCLGIAFARAGLRLLSSFAPAVIASAAPLALNGWVLGFTFAASVLTGVVCGVLPAFQSAGANLSSALSAGSKGAVRGGGGSLRNSLVVAEIALSLVLLVSAGLFLRGLGNLLRVDPGFRPEHLLTMRVSEAEPPSSVYENLTPAELNDLQFKSSLRSQQLIKAIQNLPGVKSAAGINVLPIAESLRAAARFGVEGQPDTDRAPRPSAQIRYASLAYFETMSIPRIQGRLFQESDWTNPVVVINQSMSRRFWPRGDAIGRRINFCWNASEPCWSTVVGVVGDVHQFGLDAEPTFDVYNAGGWAESLVIRTQGDPAAVASEVRAKIREFDSVLAISRVSKMEQLLSDSLLQQRFLTLLLAIFAALALLLAAVGIYGVVSYGVSRRTQEIGIRLTLGAQPGDVSRMIVREGLFLALAGTAIGLAIAFVNSRWIESFFFEVKPSDPPTYIVVSVLLLATALAACLIPARRASRVDPMVALRYD
jgi:predicted permease